MFKRTFLASFAFLSVIALGAINGGSLEASPPGQPTNWQRFYYYPYVYYPHNFQQHPQSYDHMYYRYPTERRIPVYNADWYNFYPSKKPYHWGNHYNLDIF